MKRFFCTLLIFSISSALFAQDYKKNNELAEKIMADDAYISAVGDGENSDVATQEAFSNIFVEVFGIAFEAETTTSLTNEQSGQEAESRAKTEKIVKSYVTGSLPAIKTKILHRETGYCKMFAYIKREEVDKLFEARVNNVKTLVGTAKKSVDEKKIDAALCNYYWALKVAMTLRREDEKKVELSTDDAYGRIDAIPGITQRIRDILDKIEIEIGSRQEGSQNYEAIASYEGEPVASLRIKFFTDDGESDVIDFTDGNGLLEIPSDFAEDKLEIVVEYKNKKELENQALDTRRACEQVEDLNYDEYATKRIPFDKSNEVSSEIALGISETHSLVSREECDAYEEIIQTVLETIRKKKTFSSIQEYFTPQGYDVFERLIGYGSAKIIGSTFDLKYTKMNGYVTCRSIPMQFDFKAGRRFTENVVFVFDDSLKQIDNIAFGLSEVAKEHIINNKEQWPDQSKEVLVSFLENYKTAYALKRYDYLEQIFSNNALIITGYVVEKLVRKDDGTYQTTKETKLEQQTKHQYLTRLKRVFDSNEYISIKFANNEILKNNRDDEYYFIQIKQDYFSENYGDSGWLTLQVDVNDPKQPVIHVRVWQEEYDPDNKYMRPGAYQ